MLERVVKIRQDICARNNCDAQPNYADPCAVCPNKHWGRYSDKGCDDPNRTLPSVGRMAKHAATAIGQAILNPTKVSDEEQERRMTICRSCEHYLDGRCAKCGCKLNWKTRLEAWHCPINRW